MKSVSKNTNTGKAVQRDWLGRPVRSHPKSLAAKPPRPAKKGGR